MKGAGKLISVVAAAMLASGPATAACWSNNAVEAAYVRDLDVGLMVATLRCRTQGVEMTADYNKFVRDKRAVLIAANDDLRAHFAQGSNSKAALDALDRYATSLANSHGAGSAQLDCSDYQTLVRAAVSAKPDRAALIELAARAGSKPALPSGACSSQIALAH